MTFQPLPPAKKRAKAGENAPVDTPAGRCFNQTNQSIGCLASNRPPEVPFSRAGLDQIP